MNLRHLPNIISSLRIVGMIPLIWAVIHGSEFWFIVILTAMFLSDALDGFLARKFRWTSTLGAKLDSAADILMTSGAAAGVVYLKWGIIEYHFLIYIFGGLYLTSQIISWIKFKAFPSLHLYSFKFTLLVQGAFVVVLFAFGFIPIFFVLAMVIGIIACLEEIILLLLIQQMRQDVKGLFWFMNRIHKR